MQFQKIEAASKAVTYTASIGGSVGSLMNWITANQALAMFLIACVGYLTNTVISIWYRRRLLRIAEVKGVSVEGVDE